MEIKIKIEDLLARGLATGENASETYLAQHITKRWRESRVSGNRTRHASRTRRRAPKFNAEA